MYELGSWDEQYTEKPPLKGKLDSPWFLPSVFSTWYCIALIDQHCLQLEYVCLCHFKDQNCYHQSEKGTKII